MAVQLESSKAERWDAHWVENWVRYLAVKRVAAMAAQMVERSAALSVWTLVAVSAGLKGLRSVEQSAASKGRMKAARWAALSG